MPINNIMETTWFLVTETQEQVKLTCGLLNDFNEDLLAKIASKDDYVDNLKSTVEDLCFSRIHSGGTKDHKEAQTVRALHVICVNLERIADYCVNTARQTHFLTDCSFIHDYDYAPMFIEIEKGLAQIAPVLKSRNLSGALDICKIEYALDHMYKEQFDRIMAEMKAGERHIGDLITVLFIFRYLERMGDSLLNIGEALIFAIIGDRIKIRQFQALRQTLSESGFDGTFSDIDFHSIWGSRSGCRIGKVDSKNPGKEKNEGIFKEGMKKKIQLEQDNIRHWHEIYPGLAPRIFGYQEKDETASMLVEFLSGCTLEQIILTEADDILKNVIFVFEQTLSHIWEITRRECPCPTDYMKQLGQRIEAIARVHSRFFRRSCSINALSLRSSKELIEICRGIEKEIPAPFTIFIHGDFNVNNIVYNHDNQKVNYIDLYRSRDADYVQDASVFLISNFRLPIFDRRIRRRLNRVITHFHSQFSGFAQKQGDETYEARMALALARSFFTSTRFELNYGFAKEMALRSHFLMERLAAHAGRPWADFRLPEQVFYY